MVVEVKEITQDNIIDLLGMFGKKIKKQGQNTLAKHFGKLKRDIDGLEYQKSVRSEWD
jgi:hypothetical protein